MIRASHNNHSTALSNQWITITKNSYMTDIILTTRSISPSAALQALGENNDVIVRDTQCSQPSHLHPYTPYSMSPANGLIDPNDQRLRPQLMTTLSSKGLANAIAGPLMTFGSEDLVALAEMMEGLEAATVNGTGAVVSMTANRTSSFVAAVSRYQQALLHYRKLARSRSTAPGTVAHARIEVTRHFHDLQSKFHPEIQTIKRRKMLSRRSPLTNMNHALGVAKNNRTKRAVAKLSVANHVEGTQIARLGQHANVLGTGLVVIDFGSRIGHVHT